MATFEATVGLVLRDGRRIEAGDTFTVARLPRWVVEQGAAVRVDEEVQP